MEEAFKELEQVNEECESFLELKRRQQNLSLTGYAIERVNLCLESIETY